MCRRQTLWSGLVLLLWFIENPSPRAQRLERTPGDRVYVANAGVIGRTECRDAGSVGSTVAVVDPSQDSPEIATIPVGTSPQQIALGPDGSQRAYVTSAGDNSVTVIDTATNAVAGPPIPVGKLPKGVAVSPDGQRVYVANAGDNSLSVILAAAGAVEETLPVGRSPVGVAVSPDGARVYVANSLDGTLSVLDAHRMSVAATVKVGRYPQGVAVSPNGARVYVTNLGENTLSVVNATAVPPRVITRVADLPVPRAVAVSPRGGMVYVTSQFNNTLSLVSTADNRLSGRLPARNSSGVAVSPDGHWLYVTHLAEDVLSILDATTTPPQPVARFPVGVCPSSVAVSPDGSRIYVASTDSFTDPFTGQDISQGIVSVFAPPGPANQPIVALVPVGKLPSHIAASPVDARVYVIDQPVDSNQRHATVSVIDTTAPPRVAATIPVGENPMGLAVNPAGTRLYVANLGSDYLSVIDTGTQRVVAKVKVGMNAHDVAVSPDGLRAYVSCQTEAPAEGPLRPPEGCVLTIDTAHNQVVGQPILVGHNPTAIATSPNGSQIYVADDTDGTLSIIDVATGIPRSIPVGASPGGVAVSRDGARIYVTSQAANSVAVVLAAARVVEKTIPVGISPMGVAVSPNGSRVYVTNTGDPDLPFPNSHALLSVIDTATQRVIRTLPLGVGRMPNGVAAR